MPAIHLPRLRQQVSELVQNYADPDKFLRKLQDLFAFYGDHTKRVRQRTMKTTGLPAENVPPPVLRQIVLQLLPYAENAPHAVLVLSRSLWSFAHLEHRLLAARLLGKLPLNYSKDILLLVPQWCLQNHEESILVSLATHSLEKIQKEDPEMLLGQIETWLYPPKETPQGEAEHNKKTDTLAQLNLQKLGLSAMLPMVGSQDFVNLPKIYSLLKPMLREATAVLRPYLVDVLRPLARRSPQEVAFILRTELIASPNKHLIWLARRTLDDLPPEHQAPLRALIFPQSKENE
jgi:hypothetical protein